MNDTISKLISMLDLVKKDFPVEGSNVQGHFIETVLKRYGSDPEFDNLVDTQLSLWVGGSVSPSDFYNTCNGPCHSVRNRLTTWY